MEILLSGADWKLEGYLPSGHVFNRESGIDFKIWPIIKEVPATVPGSVHCDLWKAGIIEDPYYGFNSLKCEWVENKEWRYFKSFRISEGQRRKHMELLLEGLNFEARIYLNGVLLGSHKNINTPCVYSVGSLLKEENLLEIALLGVPYDEAQMGRTSRSVLQGERFAYGWDFCTRLVGIGVWKDVRLIGYDDARLGECRIATDCDGAAGKICVGGEVQGETKDCTVRITAERCGKTVAEVTVPAAKEWSAELPVQNPALWWPAGYGDQPLYGVRVELRQGNKTIWENKYRTGIRRLEYELCEGAPENAIRYNVKINGEKIYLKGVNFLPIDHMLGAVGEDRYINQLKSIRSGNFNLIRLWGGGVKEKEILFDLCDELGILIWQDFTQSNSGLDGIPCKDPAFLAELAKSTEAILKSDRNHVSVVIYCGGNELKDERRDPVSYEDENIRMLAELVKKHDPQRIFHSGCPSGPNFNFMTDEASLREKKNHNIHGQWAYMGKELHYSYYNQGDFMYQGEFGVNGCSDESSLMRFMSARDLNGYKDANDMWTFRNYTWWNSYYREKDIFGEEGVRDISRFVPASQLVQAEGLRYIIEQNRNRAFQCCGNNIWQYGEPWPNPNCGNLVDYYMRPKHAYYTVKNSNKSVNANLRYEKLYYTPGETYSFPVRLNNLGKAAECEVTAEICTAGEVLERKTVRVTAERGTADVCTLQGKVGKKYGDLFFVRLLLRVNGEAYGENLYIFGTSAEAPYAPLFGMCGELAARLGERDGKETVMLKNVGTAPLLFVEVYAKDSRNFYCDDNFVTLFPGEERTIEISGRNGRKLFAKDFTRTILQEITGRKE